MRTLLTGAIQGSPNNLRVVTPADLPRDRSLRDWYFRYTRCDLDLSDYDLTNADVLDSNWNGVTLGVGKTPYLNSRRTTYRGANLPSDISSYNHDLVVEMYRQAPNASHPIIQYVINHVHQQYRNSWGTFFFGIQRDTRFTLQEIGAQAAIAQQGYTRIESRMAFHLSLPNGGAVEQPIRFPGKARFSWFDKHIRLPDVIDLELDVRGIGLDRWAIGQMLSQRFHDIPFYVAMLEPDVVLINPGGDRFEAQRNPDWWMRYWPVG